MRMMITPSHGCGRELYTSVNMDSDIHEMQTIAETTVTTAVVMFYCGLDLIIEIGLIYYYSVVITRLYAVCVNYDFHIM